MEIKIVDIDGLRKFEENLASLLGGTSLVDTDATLGNIPTIDSGGNFWIDE